jgi:uncharacterized glyoxalase superfamily protein PhnB
MKLIMSDKNTKVRYIVDDMEASVDFYKDHLDFTVDMHPAPGFAALSKDSLTLLLNESGAGGAGKAMPDGKKPKPGGWNRIQISVRDLEDFYGKAVKKGLKYRNEIVEGKGGQQVLLQDPSGNLIELFEPKKTNSVRAVPDGFHTITPFLVVDNAADLIDFIKAAFEGKITYMMQSEDGVVRHSTVRIGDSQVMVSNGNEMYGSMPAMLHLYVEDVDKIYKQAREAGGETIAQPEDQFYGDRTAAVRDRWSNQWWIATHIEDVGEKEMKKREKEFRKSQRKTLK